MKNNHFTKTASIIISSVFLLLSTTSFALAQLSDPTALEAQDNALMETADFASDFTIGDAVALVVEAFLGLLGIIFIFLITLAGYHWMTAAGDEQKVTKAKETIRTAVIGLIIIVAAYSITYFVFNALGKSTG
jgi:hypothetical protein